MYLIKFPHRVKIGGVYYAANVPVRVAEADAFAANGAVVIEKIAAAPAAKPTPKRAKKQPERATE